MPVTNPQLTTASSPTAGMTLEQRILHVGGRNNAAGYVEFGSTQAVNALVQQVLRDLPATSFGAAALVRMVLDDMDTCAGERGFGYEFKELSTETVEALREFAAQPAEPQGVPETWKWMTHPDWNEGKPIPVRITAPGWYQPFDADATEFEWEERDGAWAEVAPPLPSQQVGGATVAGLLSANGHLSTLLDESTLMLSEMRQLVNDLHKHWSPGGMPERGEFSLLDRVDDWLAARPIEMLTPRPAPPVIRTDVLTDAQISAGAAVTTMDGKPIGRNAAIDAVHAMCAAAQEGGAA